MGFDMKREIYPSHARATVCWRTYENLGFRRQFFYFFYFAKHGRGNWFLCAWYYCKVLIFSWNQWKDMQSTFLAIDTVPNFWKQASQTVADKTKRFESVRSWNTVNSQVKPTRAFLSYDGFSYSSCMNWFSTFRFGPVDEMLTKVLVKSWKTNIRMKIHALYIPCSGSCKWLSVQLKTAKTNFLSRRTSPQTNIKVARQKQNKGRRR